MSGPDLPNPESPDMVAARPAVPALQALTPPSEVIIEDEEKHYYCPVPNASLHANDGTRMTFIGGFFSTHVKHLKDYLDKEIRSGGVTAYLRPATEIEKTAILTKRNPQKALEDDFRDNKEPALRKELERGIVAQVLGVQPSDLTDQALQEFLSARDSGAKMSGVDAGDKVDALREKLLNKGPATISSLGAKVIQNVSPMAGSMVGTDKINAGAGESNAAGTSGSSGTGQ